MRSRLVLQIAVLILPLAAPAQAQQYVRLGSELDDYVRLLELRGTLSAAPLVFRSPTTLASLGPVARDTTHPWFAHHPFSAESRAPAGPALNLLDPDWRMVYNSRYPGTENDGALWAGRGASVALSLVWNSSIIRVSTTSGNFRVTTTTGLRLLIGTSGSVRQFLT